MRGEEELVTIPFVVEDTDRHGNVRRYYRRKGQPKIRLWREPGTKEFADELELAKIRAAETPLERDGKPAAGTLGRLVLDYFDSQDFRRLGKITRKRRRAILERICTSTVGDVRRGSLPFARMEPRHVRDIRDEAADTPEAANMRIKALRQVFAWAIEDGRASSNPAAGVRYLEGGEGFHSWTVEEVRRYQDRWPIGTTARLALDVLLYTGTRRSDAVRLGPPMERRRVDAHGRQLEQLHFTEVKNAERKVRRRKDGAKKREIPILPVLRSTIDATTCGLRTYIVTSFGKPFTSNGFGNRMRKWCDEAGLPERCSAHGLRKAGAKLAADNGATAHQLMAIFGWDTLKEAERYTRDADRRRLAAEAMHLLALPEENEPRSVVSHPAFGRGVPPKK